MRQRDRLGHFHRHLKDSHRRKMYLGSRPGNCTPQISPSSYGAVAGTCKIQKYDIKLRRPVPTVKMHTVFDLISGQSAQQILLTPKKMFIFLLCQPNKRTLNVRARVAIRPAYSKLVLPSRKSLEIIINIKIKYI